MLLVAQVNQRVMSSEIYQIVRLEQENNRMKRPTHARSVGRNGEGKRENESSNNWFQLNFFLVDAS